MELIERQAAIDTLNVGTEFLKRVLDETDIVGVERAKYEWGLGLIESYIDDMKELPSAQPETAKRIVGMSKGGMTMWYQCDICGEPVDLKDAFCSGCGRRLVDE